MKRTLFLILLAFVLFLCDALAEEDVINTFDIGQLYIGQSLSDVINALEENCVDYEMYTEDEEYTSVFTNLNAFGVLGYSVYEQNSTILFKDGFIIEVQCDLGSDPDFSAIYDCVYKTLGKADYVQIPDYIVIDNNGHDIYLEMEIMAAWETPSSIYVLKLENTISGYLKTSVFESTVDIDEHLLQTLEFCVSQKEEFFDYYDIKK